MPSSSRVAGFKIWKIYDRLTHFFILIIIVLYVLIFFWKNSIKIEKINYIKILEFTFLKISIVNIAKGINNIKFITEQAMIRYFGCEKFECFKLRKGQAIKKMIKDEKSKIKSSRRSKNGSSMNDKKKGSR